MTNGLVEFVAQALATLVGALVAFALERRRDRDSARADEANTLRKALFALALQRDFALNFRNQALAPFRDRADRVFAVRQSWVTHPDARIKSGDLGFLLKGTSEVVHEVTRADLQFAGIVSLIAMRNELHYEFQQRLEAVHVRTGKNEMTIKELEEVAGRMLLGRLGQMTRELYEGVDSLLDRNNTAATHLREAFTKKYPSEPLFTVTDNDEMARPPTPD